MVLKDSKEAASDCESSQELSNLLSDILEPQVYQAGSLSNDHSTITTQPGTDNDQ